ncbi:MAG: ATP-binding cassette domain-containing protein [Spirochaetaceae bacterium]|jgi:ABC-type oligopeptide transport system ATPase subunit|nr:ATP-binding cassette domain-containing protein [Spirochaetaceae bacterium]
MHNVILEIANLSKRYYTGLWERQAVDAVCDISFTVQKGDIFGLIGGSGCGKTSVIKMALGLSRPSGGTVLYKGKDLVTATRKEWYFLRKEIQAVFQHPQMTFNPRRNIYFACAEPVRLYGLAHGKRDEERFVFNMIEKVGISRDQLKKFPHELSGGQAQRLSIIRAVSLNPELLVCDEPTSMLDVSVQAQILQLLWNIHKERRMTMLFISHDLDVVQAFCTHVAVMRQGKIVESGPVHKVFETPQHEYTRYLISSRL